MVAVDFDVLEKQVTEIQRNKVSARSHAVYENSYGRFIAWVVRYKPRLIRPTFAEKLGDVSILTVKQLRKRLEATSVFGAWLLTLEKPDGGCLSYAALNTHKVGLFNLYRDYGREIPPTMEKELHKYFKGLKRQMVKAAAQGEISAKTGKDPFSFEL
ncbi:hypothetical protein L915_13200 [Phytophthora nicotianae]|uniref:Uncharacterized protein n=2 Tax=Phytophthora nicotianae TaxID=4792 RepID=W2GE01_PHYNI|nr:hypothetical protein L915_13200 [Phytophthora nicotianae]